MHDRPVPRFLLFTRHLPVYLQGAIAECGLACLGMVAAAYGQHHPLRELRLKFPIALSGMSLLQVTQTATAMGLGNRSVRVELNELSELRLPAILHWDLEHFVVLERVGRSSIQIVDPAVGRRKLSMADTSRHFTGVALELWPTAEFSPAAKPRRMSITSLWASISGLGAALIKVLCLSLVLQIVSLLLPLQSQLLIDQAIGRNDVSFLSMLVLGFGLIQLISAIGGFLRNLLALKLTQSLALGMRGNLVSHLLRLPLTYYSDRQLGDILSRVDSLDAVQNFMQAKSIEALIDGLMAIATFFLLLAYGPFLTLLILGSILLANLIDLLSLGYRRALSHEALVASGRQHSFLIEMLRGIRPLRFFGKTDGRFAIWQAAYAEQLSIESRNAMAGFLVTAGQELVQLAFQALITYAVVARVMEGQITIGMMTSALAYSSFFSHALTGLIHFAITWRLLDVPMDRMSDITQTAAESEAGQQVSHLNGAIEFRDVWFRYHKDLPWVLQGVNFTVKPGEHLAISGPSGCGKSTILNLLLRALEPERGEILIDGVPLRSLSVSSYRKHIGTVMQGDELFSGTIAENICLFDPQPDLGRVEKACLLANIAEDIAAMPMGYATLIGDMGSSLSGGQKQRLMLARALYPGPGLLLMDEATSHLDAGNERAVNAGIRALAMTRITIAHRQETLESADRILRLTLGKITITPGVAI